MGAVTAGKNSFTVRAYAGDAKTLLAFNFVESDRPRNLAGFTIECQPRGQNSYYLLNELRFQDPAAHARVSGELPNSTANAPIRKFRWTHVPGLSHQGTQPAMGSYTYTVTPRYFDDRQSLLPLDASIGASVAVDLLPFKKDGLSVGFTRGYMQSQAFAHHFGLRARIQPARSQLLFDTSQKAGTNPKGQVFTFADVYRWMGKTAREQVFALLNDVLNDRSLNLDVFAYDLNEPDVLRILLALAKQGRVRVILDNASLHHNRGNTKREDQFTKLFQKAAESGASILRGHFGRFAHDKIFIVTAGNSAGRRTPVKVLTGSTNFSVTGLYVNANHVLVYDDSAVAAKYSDVFNEVWNDGVSESFKASPLAATPYDVQSSTVPRSVVTFSPHTASQVSDILGAISERVLQEGKKGAKGSVIFATMQLTGSGSPVYSTLAKLHASQSVVSYGISDSPGGVVLYARGRPQGVLVTGKPGKTTLPRPFDQVPSVLGHEIHDKFVVCGFNGDDPVVYCGSSNLASGGEAFNGDNLIAVYDADVATAFAIEALLLVDHYDFLDRYAAPSRSAKAKSTPERPRLSKQPSSKQQAAVAAGNFLSTNDSWTESYYDPKDLHCMERQLFGA